MKDSLTGFGDLPLSPNIPEHFTFSALTRWLLLEIAPLLEFKDQTLQECRTLTTTNRRCQAMEIMWRALSGKVWRCGSAQAGSCRTPNNFVYGWFLDDKIVATR
jgi:hypothetical protein